MIEITGNKFVYFDVDDTLVDWNRRDTPNSVMFEDLSGTFWSLEPKWDVIRKLKEHKRNGDTVIVWSQGGWDWAKEVVKTLRLESYVDAVITKPHVFYDDLPATRFMEHWIKV